MVLGDCALSTAIWRLLPCQLRAGPSRCNAWCLLAEILGAPGREFGAFAQIYAEDLGRLQRGLDASSRKLSAQMQRTWWAVVAMV